jgi:hypothetical protein
MAVVGPLFNRLDPRADVPYSCCGRGDTVDVAWGRAMTLDRAKLSRRALMALAPLSTAAVGLVTGLGAGLVAGVRPARAESPVGPPRSPAVHRAAELRHAGGVDVARFLAPGTDRAASEAIQAAIHAGQAAGVPVRFPAGGYVVDRPIIIENTTGLDAAMPTVVGAGVGSTILEASPFEGPILSVRGVGRGPFKQSHLLHGGGLHGFELRGLGPYYGPKSVGAPIQHGIETLGWVGGLIANVRIGQLSGDGLRSVGDAGVHPNPDWTASLLRIADVKLRRLGGWGFYDANPIGSPGWTWDRVDYVLCGRGGAFVASSAHDFRSCSFLGVGFPAENTPSDGEAVAVHIAGALGRSISRVRVTGAEFDSTKDVHIALDYASACVVEQSRFIHNDRGGVGRLTPAAAVVVARSGHASACHGLVFRHNLVRLDTPGEAAGFVWKGTANVTDIEVDGLSISGDAGAVGAFKPFVGHDVGNAHLSNDYRLRTARGVVSLGRPLPERSTVVPVQTLAVGAGSGGFVPVQLGSWVGGLLPAGWVEVTLALTVVGSDVPAELDLRLIGGHETVGELWTGIRVSRTRIHWTTRVLLAASQDLRLEARASLPLQVVAPSAKITVRLVA